MLYIKWMNWVCRCDWHDVLHKRRVVQCVSIADRVWPSWGGLWRLRGAKHPGTTWLPPSTSMILIWYPHRCCPSCENKIDLFHPTPFTISLSPYAIYSHWIVPEEDLFCRNHCGPSFFFFLLMMKRFFILPVLCSTKKIWHWPVCLEQFASVKHSATLPLSSVKLPQKSSVKILVCISKSPPTFYFFF